MGSTREGGTYIVRHDRSQIDQFDAQSPQILRDQLLEIFARVLQVMQSRLDGV
jgi:hypothetical protein